MISTPRDKGISGLWLEMLDYPHLENGETHLVVQMAAQDMIDRPDEEAGSVLSAAKSYLSLYRDPVVAKNTSKSDFTLKDMMNAEKAQSLYIITQPSDKDRLRPLIRILLNMSVKVLADKMEFERVKEEKDKTFFGLKIGTTVLSRVKTKKTYKHRLLCLIDEFPSLGKMEIIQESLAFVAGYGIKFYLICQGIEQLRSREAGYGPDETITTGCHVQICYQPNKQETAEYISKMAGTTTVIKESRSYSKKPGFGHTSVTTSEQSVQRPLITPEEVRNMPGAIKEGKLLVEAGDMIVFVAGTSAIYGKQPLYFQDPIFNARVQVELD